MDTRRLNHGPTMLIVTVLLLVFYLYGYVDQIGQNNRSVSAYASSSDSEPAKPQ